MLFPETMMEAAADRAACRALLADGSRTFLAAARLLPRRVREPATALYAFCRQADDAVDLGGGDRRASLERLRLRLERVYRGAPLPLAADRAFAAVVARFAIPRALPEALLDGFAWDVAGCRCETLDDLHAYAARVAGSVGVMMALIMDVRDPAALGCAATLGMAMQLTNIARDIGEDARAGRLYLPGAWMREAGLEPEAWRAAPAWDARLAGVVARLLGEAARLYRGGEAGIAALPADCRPAIRAASALYAAIGHEVARGGFDLVSCRARVPSARKLALLLAATRPRLPWHSPMPDRWPGGAAALVACVEPRPEPARRSPDGRVAWVLDLFERLETRRHRGLELRDGC